MGVIWILHYGEMVVKVAWSVIGEAGRGGGCHAFSVAVVNFC